MSMSIKSWLEIAQILPAHHSIVVRGPHGIGKSQSVYQLGEKLGMKVIERRLSQMTEGDMMGLPFLVDGATKFAPPDWIFEAVDNAVILFLDEINRASGEVQQAAFQLVGMHEINGIKLHPQTRVITAINVGSDYQVNEMDPAFLNRFFVIDLTPTAEEWIEWARKTIHPLVVDFIHENRGHLEHTKEIEPDEVYPSRRSWHKVHQAFEASKLYDSDEIRGQLGYQIVMGYCGKAAAGAFRKFAQNYEKEITANDIINNWSKVEKRIATFSGRGKKKKIERKLDNPSFLLLIDRVMEHCSSHEWTQEQLANVFEFMKVLPNELVVTFWNLSQKASTKNSTELHMGYSSEFLLSVIEASKS